MNRVVLKKEKLNPASSYSPFPKVKTFGLAPLLRLRGRENQTRFKFLSEK